jgi:hypothetical protein
MEYESMIARRKYSPYFAIKPHQGSVDISDLAYPCEDKHLSRTQCEEKKHSGRYTARTGYVIHFVNISIHSIVSSVEIALVDKTVKPPARYSETN